MRRRWFAPLLERGEAARSGRVIEGRGPARAIRGCPLAERRILDPKEFDFTLNRERSRADRLGDHLSLVVFDATLSRRFFEPVSILAREALAKLRCTDDLGWLRPDRFSLLLPHTDRETARRLVLELLERMGAESEIGRTEVYTYPADQLPGLRRRGEQRSEPNSTVSRIPTPKRPNGAATAMTQGKSLFEWIESPLIRPLPLWKRLFDIIGAVLLLGLLCPLLLFTALLVKLTSPGPILFRQTRAGLGGRPFKMLKFRSMVADADQHKEALRAANEVSGPVFKIARDPRITRLGRWIRKLSIDELPQLWNVLVGDMSLVGPRPPTFDEVQKYDSWQLRRLEVTPGITCIWQVSGRSRIDFNSWVRMDLEYLTRRSFWFDLKLLASTIPAVLLMRGAH